MHKQFIVDINTHYHKFCNTRFRKTKKRGVQLDIVDCQQNIKDKNWVTSTRFYSIKTLSYENLNLKSQQR